MFFGVKTIAGRERLLADIFQMRAEHEKLGVYSMLVVPGLKGYIIMEAKDAQTVVDTIRGDARMVRDPLSQEDVFRLLKSEPIMKELKKGMTVEIVGGPFKGSKAKIVRVNSTKESITVELLEGTVPIPITIQAEYVRVLD